MVRTAAAYNLNIGMVFVASGILPVERRGAFSKQRRPKEEHRREKSALSLLLGEKPKKAPPEYFKDQERTIDLLA